MNVRHVVPTLAVGVSALAIAFTLFLTGSAFFCFDLFTESTVNLSLAEDVHCQIPNIHETEPVDISLVADRPERPVERAMLATIHAQGDKPFVLLKPYHDGFVARSGWVRCEEFSTAAEQFVRTQIEGNVSEPLVVVVAYETLQESPKDAELSGDGDHKSSRPRFLKGRLVAIRLREMSS